MPPTSAAPPRRRSSRSTSHPPARPAAPLRRRPSATAEARQRGLRLFVGVLVVLALAVAGFAGYQALRSPPAAASELREEVRGHGRGPVDEIRGLIEDNTQ